LLATQNAVHVFEETLQHDDPLVDHINVRHLVIWLQQRVSLEIVLLRDLRLQFVENAWDEDLSCSGRLEATLLDLRQVDDVLIILVRWRVAHTIRVFVSFKD
jgi:hypothetical protein